MSDDIPYKRTVRSFVRRNGRMSDSHQRAFERSWPTYGLSSASGIVNLETLFPDADTYVLEIGFGMGQSLLSMAQESPQTGFIGIEVHHPGVGVLISGIESLGLNNIRVYEEDAVDVLKLAIPDASLDRLQLYFPDPWPKARHHKRRLVQSSFVELIKQKLKSGGMIHFATDWEHYALQMLEVLSHSSGLVNQSVTNDFVERPEFRPKTKFETRGERLGHGVWDLVFLKSFEAVVQK